MQVSAKQAPVVSEPKTWPEICAAHPDCWVGLVEIDRPDANNFAFRTARVAGWAETRREIYAQTRDMHGWYPLVACYFTGPITAPLIGPTWLM